jgi:cytochrome d ubiquinol oxidase subunit I
MWRARRPSRIPLKAFAHIKKILSQIGYNEDMNVVYAGRAFMGITMAFHIFFALFGVGIPLMVSLAELIGIVKKDDDFTAMARRWTFAMTVLFVAGAISGTIISVLFVVLLPPFMSFISKVVILPFSLETYAFFLEAIFLGIYAYTWTRFKNQWVHWLISIPLIIGSAASAFFITTVNAFMVSPQGFTDVNGVISNVNQWVAMFNPATATKTSHSILAYYATTAFVFAAVAVFSYLWKKNVDAGVHRYAEKMAIFSLVVALIFSLGVVVTGDSSARFIAQNDPAQFAAGEGVMQTGRDVPLKIGGIEIPGLLSLLTGGSRDTLIVGLDAISPSLWPPLVVHEYFDTMAGIGILMLIVPIAFFLLWWWRRRRWVFSKIMAGLIVVTGALSVIAVELGWMFSEEGRQPYTIRGIMLTNNAFTSSTTVMAYAVLFPIFYLVLIAVTAWVLAAHYKKQRT